MSEDVSIHTEEALRHSLTSHGIDVSLWGEDGSKTIGDLFSELRERELLGYGRWGTNPRNF